MALIMLAIGGLLALAGAYAMATGFPVIEVERGWSMVISGAVLLSGGLVVMALGIVVRAINGLKAGMPISVAPAQHDEPSLAPSVVAPRAPDLSPAVVDAPRPTLAVAAPAAAAVLATGIDYAGVREPAPQEPAPHESYHAPELEAHKPVEPQIDHLSEDTAPADHSAETDHEVQGREPADHAWHEPDFSASDLDAPHETADVPAPLAAPEPAPQAIEPHETREPAAPKPEPVAAVPEPTPEPVAEAPATAPDTPPGNLNVIGRYDSDGTSYVMYSDGSIEAQSESGVFRFGSMAELKAFIEG